MKEKVVKTFFPKEVKEVKQGNCPICKNQIKINDFKDKLSIKEFEISGLCQKCQDEIFGC